MFGFDSKLTESPVKSANNNLWSEIANWANDLAHLGPDGKTYNQCRANYIEVGMGAGGVVGGIGGSFLSAPIIGTALGATAGMAMGTDTGDFLGELHCNNIYDHPGQKGFFEGWA